MVQQFLQNFRDAVDEKFKMQLQYRSKLNVYFKTGVANVEMPSNIAGWNILPDLSPCSVSLLNVSILCQIMTLLIFESACTMVASMKATEGWKKFLKYSYSKFASTLQINLLVLLNAESVYRISISNLKPSLYPYSSSRRI